ncbi:MAG: hypothetical protein HZA01_15055 [Nitrospinae bacterium]|nr:hypothetical protein [Nitrospinota bacterium]
MKTRLTGGTHPSFRFQAGWFSSFTVEKVIQLSDMRFILFENASCPAMIVKYKSVKPVDKNYMFDYEVPKVDRHDPRKGIVTVLAEDQKKIMLTEVTSQSKDDNAPTILKKTFWGSLRDTQFINRLQANPPLNQIVASLNEGKRWIKGQGVQPDTKGTSVTPQKPWWKPNHLFINAKSKLINLILLKSDCYEIRDSFPVLHRPRDPKLFQGPMVLANQGFSKFAYVDFDILFQDSLQSICGPKKDEDLLKFLAAVLKSNLSKYFLFHTSANWGIERDKVHFFELLRLPFPLPESTPDPSKSEQIVKQVADCFERLKEDIQGNFLERKNSIKETQGIIEPLIYDYYEISEQEKMLIEDTVNILEPSSTPHSVKGNIPTLKPATFENRKTYVDLLCEVLNSWGKRSKFKVSGEAKISTSIGLGIVTLRKSDSIKPYSENTTSDALQSSLKRITKTLPEEKGRFSYLRGLKVFEKNELHIVKPLALRHWTRSAALNDADEIAAAILSAGRDN